MNRGPVAEPEAARSEPGIDPQQPRLAAHLEGLQHREGRDLPQVAPEALRGHGVQRHDRLRVVALAGAAALEAGVDLTEDDHLAADSDAVPGLKALLPDALTVDEGAVGAVQVPDHVARARRHDLRVAPRGVGRVEGEVAALAAAQHHGALLADRQRRVRRQEQHRCAFGPPHTGLRSAGAPAGFTRDRSGRSPRGDAMRTLCSRVPVPRAAAPGPRRGSPGPRSRAALRR